MSDVAQLLVIHVAVVVVALCLAALYLWRCGLLTVLHTGFWMVLAFALYFVYNPLAALLSGDVTLYEDALYRIGDGGVERFYLVLALIVGALGAFVLAYSWGRHRHKGSWVPFLDNQAGRWTYLNVLLLLTLLAAAAYSLLFLRTRGAFTGSTVDVEIEGGRIVGGATGYTVVAHAFSTFCVALMLFRGPRVVRWIGVIVAVVVVFLRLYDPHDRASIVVLVAVVGLVALVRGKSGPAESWLAVRRLARSRFVLLLLLAAAGGLAAFLVLRGHESVTRMDRMSMEVGMESLRAHDTAMLPVFYVESGLADATGYDYGAPVVSSALLGWIPRRFAPWKDDFARVLSRGEIKVAPSEERWLSGAKATIIGSFYWHGGPLGVLVGMLLLGIGARKLDAVVASARTDTGRALGIVWMANVWMMFASSDLWVIQSMFTQAIPFVLLFGADRLVSLVGTPNRSGRDSVARRSVARVPRPDDGGGRRARS